MMDPSGSRKQQTIMANNNSPEISMAGEVFDQFCNANTLKSILGHFRQLCDLLKIKPNTITQFYPKLKAKLRSWKAQALWKKFDQRANHKCYNRGKACPNTRVLIIGGGPCGLRSAIEAQLLGAKVVVVEKRDRMSRNNVLHLWPFVIHDLRGLGAKKFFGKFCAGSIDHISIRQLQCILLKVALILGVEFHENVSFDSLVPPPDNQEDGKIGWRAKTTPADHPVSQYEFDVLIGADGKRNTLEGFKRKEFRGKLAIAITANFINKRTEAEARVEEISGVAFIFNQKFFKELYQETGIDLENIVYYKDDTHYFVMTAKKHSLIDKGVILQDHADTAKLLAKENVDREALMLYAREAAEFSTEYQMMDMEFAVNHYGQPDVAMFDFTSMYAAENASRVLERHGHRLLMILVGDSLLEPFWPTGSGCARGFLSSLDACWAIKGWGASMPPLDVIAERESIYRLLGQTTPENLNRDYAAYTLDPHTRYPNLNVSSVTPIQVRTLFDTDDPESIKQATEIDIPKKRRRRDLRGDSHVHPDTLLRWLQKQVCLYDNVKIDDMGASFKDGLAICAIIHRYRPDLIDFHRLQRDDVAQNNQLAFDILEKELGISPIMTGEEIAQCDVPDKLAMFSYLTQIYEVFRGEIPHVKHPQLELDEEERAGNSKQLTQLTGRVARQDSATRARHSRSRHNENLNPLEKKGDTTSRRSRKRRSTEKMGATVDREPKIHVGHRRASIDEEFSGRIKNIEDKLRGSAPSEKKPRDLLRAIGKIEKTDWNVKEIEKKIEESKMGRAAKHEKVERVPKWSREQFLARQTKMERRGREQKDTDSKYADIDNTLKSIDRKIKEGNVLGYNKVSAMAEQFSNKSQDAEPKLQKSNTKPAIALPAQGGSEVCHFCNKRVYLMERLSAEGKFFHRGCFRCEYCSTSLRIGNHTFDREKNGGRFYCTQHFGFSGTMKARAEKKRVTALSNKENIANVGLELKTPEKTKSGLEGVVGLDLLDRGQTPERIEFENLAGMSDAEEAQSQMDEDEWTDRNFGASTAEMGSSDDISDMSDSDDNEVYEEAIDQPLTTEGTLELAKNWTLRYSHPNTAAGQSDTGSNEYEDSSDEYTSEDDESGTATEDEEDIRARELRKQEVWLKQPARSSDTDTGSETEVKISQDSLDNITEQTNQSTGSLNDGDPNLVSSPVARMDKSEAVVKENLLAGDVKANNEQACINETGTMPIGYDDDDRFVTIESRAVNETCITVSPVCQPSCDVINNNPHTNNACHSSESPLKVSFDQIPPCELFTVRNFASTSNCSVERPKGIVSCFHLSVNDRIENDSLPGERARSCPPDLILEHRDNQDTLLVSCGLNNDGSVLSGRTDEASLNAETQLQAERVSDELAVKCEPNGLTTNVSEIVENFVSTKLVQDEETPVERFEQQTLHENVENSKSDVEISNKKDSNTHFEPEQGSKEDLDLNVPSLKDVPHLEGSLELNTEILLSNFEQNGESPKGDKIDNVEDVKATAELSDSMVIQTAEATSTALDKSLEADDGPQNSTAREPTKELNLDDLLAQVESEQLGLEVNNDLTKPESVSAEIDSNAVELATALPNIAADIIEEVGHNQTNMVKDIPDKKVNIESMDKCSGSINEPITEDLKPVENLPTEIQTDNVTVNDERVNVESMDKCSISINDSITEDLKPIENLLTETQTDNVTVNVEVNKIDLAKADEKLDTTNSKEESTRMMNENVVSISDNAQSNIRTGLESKSMEEIQTDTSNSEKNYDKDRMETILKVPSLEILNSSRDSVCSSPVSSYSERYHSAETLNDDSSSICMDTDDSSVTEKLAREEFKDKAERKLRLDINRGVKEVVCPVVTITCASPIQERRESEGNISLEATKLTVPKSENVQPVEQSAACTSFDKLKRELKERKQKNKMFIGELRPLSTENARQKIGKYFEQRKPDRREKEEKPVEGKKGEEDQVKVVQLKIKPKLSSKITSKDLKKYFGEGSKPSVSNDGQKESSGLEEEHQLVVVDSKKLAKAEEIDILSQQFNEIELLNEQISINVGVFERKHSQKEESPLKLNNEQGINERKAVVDLSNKIDKETTEKNIKDKVMLNNLENQRTVNETETVNEPTTGAGSTNDTLKTDTVKDAKQRRISLTKYNEQRRDSIAKNDKQRRNSATKDIEQRGSSVAKENTKNQLVNSKPKAVPSEDLSIEKVRVIERNVGFEERKREANNSVPRNVNIDESTPVVPVRKRSAKSRHVNNVDSKRNSTNLESTKSTNLESTKSTNLESAKGAKMEQKETQALGRSSSSKTKSGHVNNIDSKRNSTNLESTKSANLESAKGAKMEQKETQALGQSTSSKPDRSKKDSKCSIC